MMVFIQLLPVLVSLCLAAAAILLRCTNKRGIKHPVYTDAIVVSKVTQMGYHNHSTVELSAPVVRYRTEQGERTAIYRRYVPDWQYRYRNGETIRICYEKNNHGKFQICHDQGNRWKSDLLFSVAGMILVAYVVLWIQYY